jgi:hypothetical protein
MPATHRAEVEAILAGARAEHRALLEAVSPELRASLPVDATGITQAIEHLGAALGLADLRREQAHAHQANPAVLHGRVFGRSPLSPDTVLAAFVEGARVRAGLVMRLAEAVGGPELAGETRALMEEHPPPLDAGDAEAAEQLRETYAAQEDALVRIAARLDAHG